MRENDRGIRERKRRKKMERKIEEGERKRNGF